MPAALSLRTLAVSGVPPGHRDHRDLAPQPFDLVRVEHPVVQDDPVALAGEGEGTAARVVLVETDRTHQDVEARAAGRLPRCPG